MSLCLGNAREWGLNMVLLHEGLPLLLFFVAELFSAAQFDSQGSV